MNWFNENIPDTPAPLELHLQRRMLSSNDGINLGDCSVGCNSMQPFGDFLQCDEPFSFDCGDLDVNEFDYDNDACSTGAKSPESNCYNSSCGSDSTNSNQPSLDNSKNNLRLIENRVHGTQTRGISNVKSAYIDSCSASEDNNYENGRRSYCVGNSNSKNAIAARDNRLKKKKYIENLEESVQNLRSQNDYLLEQSNKTKSKLCDLQNEVLYLRRVISNQSVLSAVLKNVVKTPGIKLSTSLNLNDIDGSNDCKKEGLVHHTPGYDFKNSHKYSSTEVVKSRNSLRSSQSSTSSPYPKRKSKRISKVKKAEEHENVRVKYDEERESNIAVNVEFSGDSDASNDSILPGKDITGGICLHVAGNHVSFELCSHCNKNATIGIAADHSYVKQ